MRRALLLLCVSGCAGRQPVDWTASKAPARASGAAGEERAPQKAHVDDEAELRRGIALVEQDDLAGGEAALRAAFAAAPRDSWVSSEAQRWLGHVRIRSGDPLGALEFYHAALGALPADPWLHYASGVAWSKLGELERAAECFTRALEHDERHIKSLQWRGETRLQLGEHAEAFADLDRAIACIESASPAELARADSDRKTLLERTLDLRAQALDALGEHERAAADRERRARLLEED